MKVCGIICEYNPFHNGHAYHIQKARELSGCDILVCVMSGNAVQRGEMAIADKWTRSEVAVQQGCDLVVELPYPFVVQRGDRFAHGAIQVLKQAAITSLVFGSESADLPRLQALTQQLQEPPLRKKGQSNVSSLAQHLNQRLASNDMLAVFYLKELEGSTITPYPLQRTNDYHSLDTQETIASASAIRQAFYAKQEISHMSVMPSSTLRFYTWDTYYKYIQTFLLSASKEYLATLFLMDEGIESLLQKQAARCCDYTSFIANCTSARYTRSSIQRTLMHLMTQTRKVEIDQLCEPEYLRILSYNEKGQAYLRTLQDQGKKIASTFKQIPEPYRNLELRLTNAFTYPCSQEERQRLMKRELLPARKVQ